MLAEERTLTSGAFSKMGEVKVIGDEPGNTETMPMAIAPFAERWTRSGKCTGCRGHTDVVDADLSR